MTINIITRCTRQENLLEISKTIYTNLFDIKWYILFDTSFIKQLDADLINSLSELGVILKFWKGEEDDFGHNLINRILDQIQDGWIYILDDDNKIHEDFYFFISNLINVSTDTKGFIFSQKVGGVDFSGVDIRYASPENVCVGKIDMAQFLLKRDLIGDIRLDKSMYVADGKFIMDIYSSNSKDFLFINQVLCYYNFYQKPKLNSLPRILLIGYPEKIQLKSIQSYDYECKDLQILQVDNDLEVTKLITKFNPDSIVTYGENWNKFVNMSNKAYDIRKRWIHLTSIDDISGQIAYNCANINILDAQYEEEAMVSFFTSVYNTGEKLWRTFESIRRQTYTNWEWVLVNDSTDSGKTYKIAEQIRDIDSRVKLYDFKEKSGGIVGEAKYRAASLCKGKWIMEMDHDDYLTHDAAWWMVKAFNDYPDCKFVYSDCAEVFENGECINYGDGFSFGYGSYRDEEYDGKVYKVINTSSINPKTIRHIVGVPNHFRAWDRKFYHQIGGHNRRLTIADDYELIVRTFLETRMLRIPKLLYIQYYHNNNTQNQTRTDIQRRVRSIRDFYNIKINKRFLELGVKDWAYDFNQQDPLYAISLFGEAESSVNYIMKIEP
jgi:glycosyltransferase involved in cell wall biosynthesis